MEDNIIRETVEFNEMLFNKIIEENIFITPEDGIGGDKNEDN